MIRKSYFSAIVAVLALVACSKDFQEPCPVGPISSDNVHTLSVGIEAGTYTPAEGETKASMEAVVRVNWQKNDEVSVVNATTGKILEGCLKAKEAGVSVTFEGTVTGEINNGNKLYYIYPKLNNTGETAFADAGYDVSLAGQTYDGDNPDKVSFFGYAEDVAGSAAISKKIQFKLVTSYAHLNMANLPAKGFNLSSIDISKINKGFKWSLSDSGELTADAYGENESISVNCSNCKITQAGNAVVRFAIPASAATGSEPRVVTVNKAYTNDKYVKDQLIPSAYYNQLYTSWTNDNVNVNSVAGDKTEVTIDNLGSTETAEGILPVSGESSPAFDSNKETEIKLGGLGTITFNKEASEAIKTNTQNAQSTNVFFKVEDVTKTKPVQNANLVYEITMKTVDGNGTEVFSEDNAGTGSKATVVIELGQSVESVESVSLVDDNGNLVSGDVTIDSFCEGKLTFTVVHFSKYAIKYTTKAEPESGYVAQIGGRKYETLASAIAAAQNGNTIQMIADYEIVGNAGVTIEKNQNIILDLAGYTVKNLVNESKASQIITNKGTLKIIGNGTLTNTLADGVKPGDWPDYNYVTNLITNLGTLTIENGTFANTQDSGITYALDNNSNGVDAVATINGGKFTSVGNSAVRMFCNSTTAANTLTINGGYFEGKYYAVSVSNASGATKVGTLNVNGGEFESTADKYNACIANWESNKSSNISVNITGGKFNDYVLIASNAAVTGGLFKYKEYTDPDDKTEYKLADYVAEKYGVIENTDDATKADYPWMVDRKYVAMIGSTKYDTLVEALAAVKNGDVLTLTSNVTLSEKLLINGGKDFTLDLGGKILTGRVNVDGAKLVVKNGKIDAGSFSQALNVYGSKNPQYKDGIYTYVKVENDVILDGSNGGLCVMCINGENYYPLVYGVKVDFYGKAYNVPAQVIGNLGYDNYKANIGNVDISANLPAGINAPSNAMSLYGPIVNIYGEMKSTASGEECQAFILSGMARVNVFEGAYIEGSEGIAMKSGNLHVYGGTIKSNGAKKDPVQAVNSGSEASGAAISITSTYTFNLFEDKAKMLVNIEGGDIQAINNSALLVTHSYKDSKPIALKQGVELAISDGKFTSGSDVPVVFIDNAAEGDEFAMPAKFISGGLYNKAPEAGYIADDKNAVQDTQGYWKIVKK